jgi:hypothetical protein
LCEAAGEHKHETAHSKREAFLRRIARKRGSSVMEPAIPGEPGGSPGEESPPALQQESPGSVVDKLEEGSDGTAARPEPVAITWTAEVEGAAGSESSDATAESASDVPELRRETIFQRIARRRNFYGTGVSDEVAEEMAEGAPETSPLETALDQQSAEPVSTAAAAPVPVDPAQASTTAAEPASTTAAEPPTPAVVVSSGPKAYSVDRRVPGTASKLGEIATSSASTSWRRTVPPLGALPPRAPEPAFGESTPSWEPHDMVPRFVPRSDSTGMAPAGTRRSTWGGKEVARRSRRTLRRLMVAAIVTIFVGLAVTYPVRAWWLEGWSVMLQLESTTTTTTIVGIGPSGNARVSDIAGDPRSAYIEGVVRAGIIQLKPNPEGEVSFLPTKTVARGEFLVWLDRVRPIPAGTGEVPDTFYYDLAAPLREAAIRAYQRRIVVEWPDANPRIAFNAAVPILARDVEAWAARMIVGQFPSSALQRALGVTEAVAADLRARISSLNTEELSMIVQRFDLVPELGWVKKTSITRSEAAEFLMKLKAVFDRYLPV